MSSERSVWPTLQESTLRELASAIDGAARRTRRTFDDLPLEDRLTGKFFGLLDHVGQVRVPSGDAFGFRYTTFPGTVERETGADGAMILSVRTAGQVAKKVLLFQAKRLPGDQSRTRLEIRYIKERARLRRQLDDLNQVAGPLGSVALFYSREGFYAVDGARLLSLAESDIAILRNPLRRATHPWTIGRCLAHLAFACKIGNSDPMLLHEVERDGLKAYARARKRLRHRFEVTVDATTGARPPEAGGDVAHLAARGNEQRPFRAAMALPSASSVYETFSDVLSEAEESAVTRAAFDRVFNKPHGGT